MNTSAVSAPRAWPWQIMMLSFLLIASPLAGGADSLPEAVQRADAAHIRMVLAGQPDLQAQDADGNTALHWAALQGEARLVQELLEPRSAAVSAAGSGGVPPPSPDAV